MYLPVTIEQQLTRGLEGPLDPLIVQPDRPSEGMRRIWLTQVGRDLSTTLIIR
jgi:hypothetical protein